MRCSPCGIDRSFSPKKESAAYTDCNTRGSLGGSSCTRPILRRFSSRCRTRARSSPDHRGWPVGAGPPFHSSRLTRVRPCVCVLCRHRACPERSRRGGDFDFLYPPRLPSALGRLAHPAILNLEGFRSIMVSQPEGSNHALVPLLLVLFRGRIPREHPPPSRQWDLGECLPEPLRITTGGRLVLLDGQRPMGPFQPCRGLPARLSCRQFQSAQDPTRARPRGGHPDHVANACPRIRTVPRGAVSRP